MSDLLSAFVTADVPLTPDNVKPGWLAFWIVMLLCAATFVLVRSFIKHTKRAAQPWPGEDRDDSSS